MSDATVLLADDNGVIRYMVGQQVAKLGITVVTVANGMEVLAKLNERSFDVLLLDVMMPELDGLGVLAEIRKHSEWREMPVIMISGIEEVKTAAQCIEAGAEDYLTKPIDMVLLHARLRSLLERRKLREAERRYYRAMLESQQALRAEMEAAAAYVRSLLPNPLQGEISVDWRFIPSEQMGGDAFGYHWASPDHLAIYLLDVCGHGFGATLLATSALNVLRSQTLAGADFTDPSTVLTALNDAFQMDRQNGNYFTLWYGVFHRPSRKLTYASSMHPPALLFQGPERVATELATSNSILGAVSGLPFLSESTTLSPGSELFIYSDGAMEVSDETGSLIPFSSFVENLRPAQQVPGESLDRAVYFVAQYNSKNTETDDFSMLHLIFR